MTEPWSTILAILWLGLYVGAGSVLVYWAIRLKCWPLVVLCLALVVWPIAGDAINALASKYAVEVLQGGDRLALGLWKGSPGQLVTQVAWFVNLVQAGLVLAAALSVVGLAGKRSCSKDP